MRAHIHTRIHSNLQKTPKRRCECSVSYLRRFLEKYKKKYICGNHATKYFLSYILTVFIASCIREVMSAVCRRLCVTETYGCYIYDALNILEWTYFFLWYFHSSFSSFAEGGVFSLSSSRNILHCSISTTPSPPRHLSLSRLSFVTISQLRSWLQLSLMSWPVINTLCSLFIVTCRSRGWQRSKILA